MSWPTQNLEDLCEIVVGRTPARKNPEFWGVGHPWVSIGDMRQGRFITSTKEEITPLGAASGKLIPAGSILLSFKLSIGKVAISKIPLYTNEAIAALLIREPEKVDRNYLVHALLFLNLAERANSAVLGATLNKATLRKVSIPVPPIAEQRRIAAILDQADAIRTKRRDAIDAIDSIRGALSADIFELSDKFPSVSLGECLDFLTSGSRGWAKYYSNSGSPFIRIQNVGGTRLNLDDIAYVDPPDNAEAMRTKSRPGDVLLSITADLGRTAVVPDGLSEAYVNQHLAILRSSKFVPIFLSAYLESPRGRRQLLKRNRGAAKAGLNFEDIRSVKIPLLPWALQEEFARGVAHLFQYQQAIERSKLKDEELFASLQARAFRGEL